MGTPFETLPKEEQQDWRESYDAYAGRIVVWGGKLRPFSKWITDFGFTHKVE